MRQGAVIYNALLIVPGFPIWPARIGGIRSADEWFRIWWSPGFHGADDFVRALPLRYSFRSDAN
ncbi:hypothetical protein A9Z06_02640 [Rhizobium sp. YK2]|nr:hypothetical protein A9Z06_02640 [Rhizobium sp. YK2]